MVSDLFLKLRNDRKFFMPAKTGKYCEDNIAEGLSQMGFTIYVRKAFEQHSSVGGILDYFKHPDRKQVELKAIKRIKALET